MTGLIILFGILAIFFALGMIGDKDADNRENYTVAFCTLVLAITVLVMKFM